VSAARPLVGGIFVGGRGVRMHGVAKGLLRAPDGVAIATRTMGLLDAAGAECVLVGEHPAYAPLGVRALPDDPSAEGPLGGLLAFLAWAGERAAIAIACDMPRIDASLVRRLVDAPPATIVAPRRGGLWDPLFARYDAAGVLPLARSLAARGERRLQRLLDAAGAAPLELTEEERARLVDWDRPEDVG